MKITKHFSLSEFTKTSKSVDNTPDNESLKNIYILAVALERAREALGGLPINITSGYRSKELNDMIGGSPTSDHCKGLAADFKVGALSCKEVVRLIKKSGIKYDQLILEPTWVHLGMGGRMRQQTLQTSDKVHYYEFTG